MHKDYRLRRARKKWFPTTYFQCNALRENKTNNNFVEVEIFDGVLGTFYIHIPKRWLLRHSIPLEYQTTFNCKLSVEKNIPRGLSKADVSYVCALTDAEFPDLE